MGVAAGGAAGGRQAAAVATADVIEAGGSLLGVCGLPLMRISSCIDRPRGSTFLTKQTNYIICLRKVTDHNFRPARRFAQNHEPREAEAH